MRDTVAEILQGLSQAHYDDSRPGVEPCLTGDWCLGKLRATGAETLRWTQQWEDGAGVDEEVARLSRLLEEFREEVNNLEQRNSEMANEALKLRGDLERLRAVEQAWNGIRPLVQAHWDAARREWWDAARREWWKVAPLLRQLGLVE